MLIEQSLQNGGDRSGRSFITKLRQQREVTSSRIDEGGFEERLQMLCGPIELVQMQRGECGVALTFFVRWIDLEPAVGSLFGNGPLSILERDPRRLFCHIFTRRCLSRLQI